MCLRKILKSFFFFFFLASAVEEVVQACHPAWKRQRDGWVKQVFVSANQPERNCHHQHPLLPTCQCFTGFSKVNRAWLNGAHAVFPTTGNKFACQACTSQIKHALFRMIYEADVVWAALGCKGLRVWWWWGGRQVGRWVGECQICLTGRLICWRSEGAHCSAHLCH